MTIDILKKSGKKVVLLGNEAIARGAIEAGVGLVAAFPGTPSSEVPITLSRLAKKIGFYFGLFAYKISSLIKNLLLFLYH